MASARYYRPAEALVHPMLSRSACAVQCPQARSAFAGQLFIAQGSGDKRLPILTSRGGLCIRLMQSAIRTVWLR